MNEQHPLFNVAIEKHGSSYLEAVQDRVNKYHQMFRSMEAMKWPFFGPGFSRDEERILYDHCIYNAAGIPSRMFDVYSDARRYLMEGSADPALCAEFMRKARALAPEIATLEQKFEKIASWITDEPDFEADAFDKLVKDERSLEGALEHVRENSWTENTLESYKIFFSKNLYDKENDLCEGVDYLREIGDTIRSNDTLDDIIMRAVNAYMEQQLCAAIRTLAKERVEEFDLDFRRYDEDEILEHWIQAQLHEQNRLHKYDRSLSWAAFDLYPKDFDLLVERTNWIRENTVEDDDAQES
jgi:hypothetical protein